MRSETKKICDPEQRLAAELAQDVSRELMSHFARACLVHRAEIELPDGLRFRDIGLGHVEKPSKKNQLVIADSRVPEGQPLCGNGRACQSLSHGPAERPPTGGLKSDGC